MSAAAELKAAAAERILVKDGAYGTSIQARRLQAEDYCRGFDLFKDRKPDTSDYVTEYGFWVWS